MTPLDIHAIHANGEDNAHHVNVHAHGHVSRVAPNDDGDDWAIEGFDSPRSVPRIIQLGDDSEHSDHVFDIEL